MFRLIVKYAWTSDTLQKTWYERMFEKATITTEEFH